MLKIAFSQLSGNELSQLAHETDEIISNWAKKELGLGLYYGSFKAALENYNNQKNNLSNEMIVLHDKAALRADYCSAFFNHIENYLFAPDIVTRNEVKQLWESITRFNPDIHRKCCRTETIILQTVIGRIELEYKELLVKIMADEWFNLLKNAQIDFEKSVKQIILKYHNKADFDIALNCRQDLIATLKRLFVFLPMQYSLTNNLDLAEIIKKIKVEFDKF